MKDKSRKLLKATLSLGKADSGPWRATGSHGGLQWAGPGWKQKGVRSDSHLQMLKAD